MFVSVHKLLSENPYSERVRTPRFWDGSLLYIELYYHTTLAIRAKRCGNILLLKINKLIEIVQGLTCWLDLNLSLNFCLTF